MIIKKIIDKIKNSKTFLITTHMNVEGDALGSALAMYAILRSLNKKAYIYLNDAVPSIYKFLPFSDKVKNTIVHQRFDVVIALDCSDSSRTGKVKDALGYADCIINIDHHISNTYFGDLNWVEPKSSSACQILFKLCERLKIMNKNIALCLYTGISTDTGNFTYSIADSQTHQVVAGLMKYGINPHKVYENIHSACGINDIKFISKLVTRAKLDDSRKICWITTGLWEEKTYDLTEIIFSVLRLLRGVEVFLIFKQIAKDKIRVNFRSRHYIDVNRIASFFGGGGHKRASGTTIEGNLSSTEKKVISFVKRYVYNYKKSI